MILADGDVVQYKELKKCTIGEYLIKLDNFVSSIESTQRKKVDLSGVKKGGGQIKGGPIKGKPLPTTKPRPK